MSFVNSIKLWILVSVFATLAGWTLSFFGVLNAIGYVVMGVIGLIVYFQIRGRGFVTFDRYGWSWKKIRKRFCGPIPLLFLFATVLVFIGGLIYPPTNHTGLSYRVPRVLHWLDANQWHWIYAPNFRMNTRACGIEWMSAPLLAILKSDRLLFLLNFIPFVLMPGLAFSFLKRLGVRGRVAWSWMWMLPMGYVFLLQAGSLGNDAFPVIYGMAAIDFACRAWKSQRAEDVWFSMLALALLTGAKASNMPLGLMWLVLAFGLWPILKRNPIGTSLVVVIVVLVSFIPTALLNLANCGSWSGLTMERAGMDMKNPLVGLWGNPPLILMSNLCPPFFPMSGWWNQNILNYLPSFIRAPLDKNFESGYQVVWEIHFEDWCGIGPGLTVLMLIAAAFALPNYFGKRGAVCDRTIIPSRVLKLALIAPWIALAAYCAKSGMVTPARLIAPYYPLLLASLLLGAEQSQLVRKGWWRALEKLAMIIAIGLLVVTPPRPLWPAKTVLSRLVESNPESKMLKRALATYTAYSIRNDPLGELRQFIPADLKSVGFVGMPDDLDISFWKPYGSRRVDHINLGETPEQIRERKITMAVVNGAYFELVKLNLAEWLLKSRAEIITNRFATIAVNAGPQKWHVVNFLPISKAENKKILPIDGFGFVFKDCEAFAIVPQTNAIDGPIRWVWYAPTLPGLPSQDDKWMIERFASAGIAVVGVDVGESYGNPEGQAIYSAFYDHLTKKLGFSEKPILLARSRGGLMMLNWAAKNPTSIAGIAGIYPVCNLISYPGLTNASKAYGMTVEQLTLGLSEFNPIEQLQPLAKARVPIFAIHGDADKTVPLELNSGEMKLRYDSMGGKMNLITVEGKGHTTWTGFFQSQELVDFVFQQLNGTNQSGLGN